MLILRRNEATKRKLRNLLSRNRSFQAISLLFPFAKSKLIFTIFKIAYLEYRTSLFASVDLELALDISASRLDFAAEISSTTHVNTRSTATLNHNLENIILVSHDCL